MINPRPGTFGRHRGSQKLTRRTYLFRGAKKPLNLAAITGGNAGQNDKRVARKERNRTLSSEKLRKSLEFAADETNRGREEESVGGEEE